MLGLCNAANTWDAEKGTFSTYATRCISNEIIREFTARKKHKGVLSLEYETTDLEGETRTIGDTIVGDEDVNWVDTDSIFNNLTPREREILDLRRMGWTNKAIAEQFGVSEQAIHKKVRKLRALWRKTNDY
jgi:RNA polymerase sporulation-specific sigma factor